MTNVNGELGLSATDDGAVSKIECTVENKRVKTCDITVKDSTTVYTATQTKIEKKVTE